MAFEVPSYRFAESLLYQFLNRKLPPKKYDESHEKT